MKKFKSINLNINLGTALPKPASILPLIVITMNILLHIIQQEPFSRSEYMWSVLGLLTSIYYGFFCKEIK